MKTNEIKDTISCWIATRINGASAGMACNGYVNIELIKELDKRIKPLINDYENTKETTKRPRG